MALTQLTVTIRSPFNEGVPGLYNAVNAWLAAHPSIIIQDVDWFRPESTRAGDDLRLRMAYLSVTAPAVGGTWAARLFRTSGSTTAQEAYNLEFGAGADLVPIFNRDITNHERVINDPDSILVIGIQTVVGPVLGMVGYDRAAFIGQPNAPIAAGATGVGTLIDAGGRVLSTTATLRNVGAVAWPAQQRNYVIMDEVTGQLLGLPSCCTPSAAPAVVSTTTTPFPCPAYLAGAEVPITTSPYNPVYQPTITSPSSESAVEGELWEYQIQATGAGTITYGVTSPPAWLTSIDPVTGEISGTPDVTGLVTINITATNAGGTTTVPLQLMITPAGIVIGDLSAVRINGIDTAHMFSQVTGRFYVGGSFGSVTDASGTYPSVGFACLDIVTGLWDLSQGDIGLTQVPTSIFVSPDDQYVYLTFTSATTAYGTPVDKVFRLDATTLALDTGWVPSGGLGVGEAHSVLDDGVDVYVGGTMPNAILKYGRASGTLDTSFDDFYTGGFTGMSAAYALWDLGTSIGWTGGGAVANGPTAYQFGYGELGKATGTPALLLRGFTNQGQARAETVDGEWVAGDMSQWYVLNPFAVSVVRPGIACMVGGIPNAFAYVPGTVDIRSLVADEDGQDLFVGGAFATFDGSAARAWCCKILAGGAVDTVFAPVFVGGSAVNAVDRLQGLVAVGGSFAGTLNGQNIDYLGFLKATDGSFYWT